MHPCRLAWVLIAALVAQLGDSVDRLIQVQVVTRHGARTPLPKHAVTLSEGGSSLTPTGEKQLYDLGNWLRTRYLMYPEMLQYNSSRVRISSSAFDRTLVSAQFLALGLFPDSARGGNRSLLPQNITRANIPVYTQAEKNDIEIRAYANCPTFQATLQQLYASNDFNAREQQHMNLLRKVAQHPLFTGYATVVNGDTFVPLEEIWNVYDAINVAMTECTPDPTTQECLSLPNPSVRNFLTDSEWRELQDVAHFVEHTKFGRETAGDVLGTNLLLRIAENIRKDNSSLRSWVVFSAHYPTILSLFAALDSYATNPALGQETIPNYASALIFELYEDDVTREREVKMVFKEGLQNKTAILDFGGFCAGIVSGQRCPASTFTQSIATKLTHTDVSGWCSVCENKYADACMAAALDVGSNDGDGSDCDGKEAALVGTAVGSFILGGVIVFLGQCTITRLSTKKRDAQKEKMVEESKGQGSVPDSAPVSLVGVSVVELGASPSD